MKEFDWKTTDYPCFGISDERIVCFSKYKSGHVVEDLTKNTKVGYYSENWNAEDFELYIPVKEKTKLWYWEYQRPDGLWVQYTHRCSEEHMKNSIYLTYSKIEYLGYIEED